ncbi:Sua5/YciO/YrdC/YwlC family protein [Portibacter lacus]|uniref:YrdC-like domain-containing protein n=1 Tax=Portibacter lacus TaxID=1099794 RepID=A0AA37SNW2_9BACT|nr:Sua5/YciO/YrdC/YwlC family protein [Portibacter lacus]GLR16221.1 hypothetical protein GCM10007940_08360 [Portibacter lacus]
MQIEDNLTLITSILENGDSILFQADGIWGVSCNALNSDASLRILEQAKFSGSHLVEILVSDLDMLKKYTASLHPRIETLLVYHERPIRLKCKAAKSLSSLPDHYDIFFRVVKDKACRILIKEVNNPLLFVSFLENDRLTHAPLHKIRTNNFKNVEFIASERLLEDEYEYTPIIKISFDNEGLIDVLK